MNFSVLLIRGHGKWLAYKFSSKMYDKIPWKGLLQSGKNCVKSAPIWSYYSPYFPASGLNTERYSVSLRIQSKCGKMRTRITLNTNNFYSVKHVYTDAKCSLTQPYTLPSLQWFIQLAYRLYCMQNLFVFFNLFVFVWFFCFTFSNVLPFSFNHSYKKWKVST